MQAKNFEERLRTISAGRAPVVPYEPGDRLLKMDFTENNTLLNPELFRDTDRFTVFMESLVQGRGARYGIGGYNELRTLYGRSPVFDASEGQEPRRLHLGIDIWGRPYTRVMAPFDGIVHSFAFNHAFGDYGATILLTHQVEALVFYTLYGHLSLDSLRNLSEGESINKGEAFAQTGIPFENGHWPPHLHFQIIRDLQGNKGDYPGVCRYSEREAYLGNCPDPDIILQMMSYAEE